MAEKPMTPERLARLRGHGGSGTLYFGVAELFCELDRLRAIEAALDPLWGTVARKKLATARGLLYSVLHEKTHGDTPVTAQEIEDVLAETAGDE